MVPGVEVKFHPEFLRDLDHLNPRELEALEKQIAKVKADPARFKHLHAVGNCYTVRMGRLRVAYYLEGETAWFLIAEKRGKVYSDLVKRLHSLRERIK